MKNIVNCKKIPGIRSLSIGERIQARYYTNLKPVWKFGTVVRKFGQLHYLIKFDNGYIFKRHIDQLRRTEVKKKVTFSPDKRRRREQGERRSKLKHIYRIGSLYGIPEDRSTNRSNRKKPVSTGRSGKSQTGLLIKYYPTAPTITLSAITSE